MQTVTVKNLITGTERQVRVRTITEWADDLKAKLAAQWDRENPARDLGARVVGPTLTAVAQSIAARSGGSIVRPF